MIKLIIKFVSIGALLLVIFACDDNDDRNNYQSEYDRSAESIGISNASISTSKEISEAEFNDTILNVTERKVSKNAQLDISVKSLSESTAFINKNVEDINGYIVSSSSYTPNTGYENKWARMSVRVPSDSLDTFLDTIIGYANETVRQSIYTQDITEQYIDVKAKIESLESSEQRLTKQLNQTDSVKEIIDIEKELSRLRSEIDSLKSRFNIVQNSVITSLVDIYIEEIPNPISIDDPSWNTRDIALDAIKALSSFGQFLIQIIIFLFVFTPVWILIAGIIYGTSKLRQRNK